MGGITSHRKTERDAALSTGGHLPGSDSDSIHDSTVAVGDTLHVLDDLPVSVPVTVGELEVMERFLIEFGDLLAPMQGNATAYNLKNERNSSACGSESDSNASNSDHTSGGRGRRVEK